MESVTFLPILAAGVASVIIGYIWYHPRVFGSVWMRLSGTTPEMAEKGKRKGPLYIFVALLAGMLVAYIMNYFGIAWAVYDWSGALQLAFWCWAGFTAPTLLSAVLWEHKPFRLYLINAIYWLVAMIATAMILLGGSYVLPAATYGSQSNSGTYSE